MKDSLETCEDGARHRVEAGAESAQVLAEQEHEGFDVRWEDSCGDISLY